MTDPTATQATELETTDPHEPGQAHGCPEECPVHSPDGPDVPLAEPDNPAAHSLARHIADHPISTIYAAFRYLNAPLTVEFHEDPDTPTVEPTPAPADLRQRIAEAVHETVLRITDSRNFDTQIADAVLAVVQPELDRAERLHQAHLEVERRLAVEAQTAQAAIERVRRVVDELSLEPHPSHDHVCPDDVRKTVFAALDEPKGRTR